MKRKKQVNKSEQIRPDGSLILDYDQVLTKNSEFQAALNLALDNKCKLEKYGKNKVYFSYEYGNKKAYILTGSVTYLSHPHPEYKKRFQLKKWYKDFYQKHSNEKDVKIFLMGIYHYMGMFLYVSFDIEDYINKNLNSSSAHVFSQDLFQGLTNDGFQKIDHKGNHLQVHTFRSLKKHIIVNYCPENKLVSIIKNFNRTIFDGKEILASDAIMEMKQNHWYGWRENQWAGWYLEYKYSGFIVAENCKDDMVYIGNLKSKDLLDFDLYFPTADFYGDLKASNIKRRVAPGNDKNNVLNAINKYGKLWYIIYEHDTVQDKKMNNVMAIKRMELLDETYKYKKGDKISSSKLMKYSVTFKNMIIFELNKINMNQSLIAFNQGRQATGDKRNPKFNIKKREIDNFLYFTDSLENIETENSMLKAAENDNREKYI